MDIMTPPSFPMYEFRAYGLAANPFFPEFMSDENLFDPLEKRRQFDWSWQAIRYRYRTCAECADEFKAVLENPSDMWQAGWGDEELTYKLERCIYTFFMAGLSVFDSFGFNLYFLGGAIQPSDFPHIAAPRNITLKATAKAFGKAFSNAPITVALAALKTKPEFNKVDVIRNLLAHRLSGRRSVRAWSTNHPDGTHTRVREEKWHIPGLTDTLDFSDDMLHAQLASITSVLSGLIAAARDFAESQKPAMAQP